MSLDRGEFSLFLFHDDVEELLVAAMDQEDAFQVIQEVWGPDAADELVLSRLSMYPDLRVQHRGLLGEGPPGKFRQPS